MSSFSFLVMFFVSISFSKPNSITLENEEKTPLKVSFTTFFNPASISLFSWFICCSDNVTFLLFFTSYPSPNNCSENSNKIINPSFFKKITPLVLFL